MTRTTPGTPEDDRPRRSLLLRTTTVVGVVVPLCLAGWLGWQAVDGHDRADGAAPAGATGTPGGASGSGTAGPDGAGPATGSGTAAVPPSSPAAPSATAPAEAAPSAPGASAPATGPGTPAPGASAPAVPAAPGTFPATALTGRTVLLDPGHNPGNFSHTAEINRQVDIGNARKECDTTGTSTNAGFTEAEFTLDVVRRARAILTARGATVVLVQDGDRPWGPCIDERAKAGNEAHADAAVSVHGDGGPAGGTGFHVIMPAKVVAGKADTSAIVSPSHRLGLLLRDGFRSATGEPYADYTASQGLDTRSDLGGLNLSTVPKVFIECGNMRNSADAKRMTDPQWRQQAAQGIADALTTFLTTR
ncbi:N-acetylmuramoyl-L-alanine amidase [Kitasatospora sp. A2-31]|uniref:N-acetylmuramoyl-L-alanine amidase n=1 Tax=Kitasatospora sp. A2-31 TaxID=2916414 RepID=UPI001EE819F9|nr:N-acetylmuramoyl-L-alanine amidase [Kitasatospora sp. A2-31]MCG6493318.1 N-acetylmuramoyl-L-alanine amidase [Kitasatospora sp. A2-31]